MTVKIWLRAETKPREKRSALTPSSARELLAAGYEVFVERSSQSAIPAQAFENAGCTMVAPGSWPKAPNDAYILGLKELPDEGTALTHRHIYFAHAYKRQRGWQETLRRFDRGAGELLDIEYLLDVNARRVAAFGYWAGFAGAAVAIKSWCGQQLAAQPVVPPLASYDNHESLLVELRCELDNAAAGSSDRPSIMVIGAAGRVGSGAIALASEFGLPVTGWDLAETARGGPFMETLAHDILINCVQVTQPVPPFVTHEMLASPGRVLRVISDVSCDPYGDYNPLPIYSECTSFDQPTLRLIDADIPLDLVAIDHLPSMLPVDSSEDFSAQLLPHLLHLDDASDPVWAGARELFHKKIQQLYVT